MLRCHLCAEPITPGEVADAWMTTGPRGQVRYYHAECSQDAREADPDGWVPVSGEPPGAPTGSA